MPIRRIHKSKVTERGGTTERSGAVDSCLMFKDGLERRAVCCVCKIWGARRENGLSILGVFEDETRYYNGYYYIIPAERRHTICRELFELTPMSYINE